MSPFDFLYNPFKPIGDALRVTLGAFLPLWLLDIVMILLAIITVASAVPLIVMIQIWAERRVIAFLQDRVGPNRVGPFGLLQSVADALKLISKEDILPAGADKVLHFLAPVIVLGFSLLVWAVIPFGPGMAIADLNVALLYIVAMAAMPSLGFIMAGWASNNKYALLGGMRAVAQFISYEVPGVLALLTPILLAGSMSLQEIVLAQERMGWFILYFPVGPIAFVLFLVAGLAEANRTPFDLVEAESEIIAGFHTEYSGMRFGIFMLAEFANVFALSAIGATLFLGGWSFFGLPIPPYLVILGKTVALVFVFIWARGTLPRFRYDQLMHFAWKGLLPVALGNAALTAVGIVIFQALLPAR